jgi:antitoxin component HigA of HigAB toxin-antitoxin module
MKRLIFSMALVTLFFAACNNSTPTNQTDKNPASAATAKPDSKDGSKIATVSISGLLTNYLQIKNALTKDNDKEAATAANEMVKTFGNFDKLSLTTKQAKVYTDIAEDALEHAEHIGANPGKIDHQREHFDMLSKDLYDLVKEFGAGQKMYYTNCPMYNNNKGANWLSETKEIRNPYLGQAMATCGSVKEELN